jgi:hypothetical protein
MSGIPRWIAPLCGLAFLTGCYQDKTSAPGELGRIEYSLYTSYDVRESDLRQARIITGHTQTIQAELTDKGKRDILHPEQLQHRLRPSQGTTVETHTGDGHPATVSVDIKVTDPGPYTLESLVGDRVMDRVDLQFETPAGFEMIIKIREPWDEGFRKVSGNPIPVEEGSQMIMLPIPVDASHDRLAGDMTTDLEVSPKWAVVPGQNAVFNTEYSMWTFRGEIDFYFIEPGTVEFTVLDEVGGGSTTQQFDVAAVEH